MVSIKQAIEDLENCELKPIKKDYQLCTTPSELIIMLQCLEDEENLFDEIYERKLKDFFKNKILNTNNEKINDLNLFCEYLTNMYKNKQSSLFDEKLANKILEKYYN